MQSSMNPKDYKLSEKIGRLTAYDLLPTTPAISETKEFLQKVNEILLDYINISNDRNEKILDFHHPNDLNNKLNLELPDQPVTLQQLIDDCAITLKYQVKTGHPYYFNQLANGLDIISMAGEWLAATANTNMFTYEIAPVFILMENIVLTKMRNLIGWNCGESILAPGGSISNLYSFLTARHKKFPLTKDKGINSLSGQLVMFTSELSHYSVKSCSSVCGLGTDNCVMVPADEKGKMISAELERLIIERKKMGHIPFFVNATAGTTVLGAFDPLNEIADICERHNCWMHVDAAWGGGMLLSRKYRSKFSGIDRSDSVTWNPHKLMGTILQCSTIHFKESGLLLSCNQMSAEYLFMTDKLYDVSYDTGDKVIQCGRHNDIFKLWLQWRSKGTEGFEKQMNHIMNIVQYQVRRIKEQSDRFYLLLEPEFVNVSFWYIPKRLRGISHDKKKEIELGKVCPIIKGRMMEKGSLMVGYQPDNKHPNFFRSIISSAAVTEKDVDYMLEEIHRLGDNI